LCLYVGRLEFILSFGNNDLNTDLPFTKNESEESYEEETALKVACDLSIPRCVCDSPPKKV